VRAGTQFQVFGTISLTLAAVRGAALLLVVVVVVVVVVTLTLTVLLVVKVGFPRDQQHPIV